MTGTNKVTCRLCESFCCAIRAAEPLFVREVRVSLQGRTRLVGHASRKFQMRHSVLAMKWPRHARGVEVAARPGILIINFESSQAFDDWMLLVRQLVGPRNADQVSLFSGARSLR